MTRVLFVGQRPETVDFTDPSLPGLDADTIARAIRVAAAQMEERGWQGDLRMITPDDAGLATLAHQLGEATYDCVVIGAGIRLPPPSLHLFEKIVNLVHRGAPRAAIAFNTHPEDTVAAMERWLGKD
jgi:hypothetical protein